MPIQLENINFELQRELELANNKLAVAVQGLKIILDSGDVHKIAHKTLKEIEVI